MRYFSYDPVSICLSVTSRCCIETTGRIELVFSMEASFHLSYAAGNWGISKKDEHFSLELCSKLWTQKFSPGQLSRPRCQQTYRRSSLLTVDHTYDDRRVVAVYCTSVDCNTLTPLLRFVVDLLYKLLFLRLYSS